MNDTHLDETQVAGSIDICGKTIRYIIDKWGECGWNATDVTDTNAWWAKVTKEFGALLPSHAVTKLCLMSRNLEARAHLYRRTHGVQVSPNAPWGSPYNAKDVAVCLGYDNPSETIRKYFRHAPSELTVSQVYRLATGSTLPDAEEFVEALFDSSITEDCKKFGQRKHCNIPFVYKDTIIRTFVENDGGLLFCIADIAWALGIVDYEEEDALNALLGEDMKKRKRRGYGDMWDTVITEAGLDKLIEQADSPEGESLKQWVSGKVKPALR